jgi:hypothetical protein
MWVSLEPAKVFGTQLAWYRAPDDVLDITYNDNTGGEPDWLGWDMVPGTPSIRVYGDVVPEPSTWLLVAAGGLILLAMHRQKSCGSRG